MKKVMKTLTVILLALVAQTAYAQELRLNLYSAYVFDDKFDSYYDNSNYYEGKIMGGYQWGAGIEYFIRPEYSIELIYKRQDTHAPTTYQNGIGTPIDFADFDLALNYIMLGGGRHVITGNEKIDPYGGLMAGMVIADLTNPNNDRNSSATKFAWGLRLGCNIWVTPKVGLKLQAELLSAVQAAGGGFYFGTGGAGAGVSAYSSFYQFGLGGGLVFKVRE